MDDGRSGAGRLDGRLGDLGGRVGDVRVLLAEYVGAGDGAGEDDRVAVPGPRTARRRGRLRGSRHLSEPIQRGLTGSSAHARIYAERPDRAATTRSPRAARS